MTGMWGCRGNVVTMDCGVVGGNVVTMECGVVGATL